MPLNLCDDILNIISEYADMKIETKKYKSLKNSNKMKLTKMLYKCCNCERMMPYYRINIEENVNKYAKMTFYVECKNYRECNQVYTDDFRSKYFLKI